MPNWATLRRCTPGKGTSLRCRANIVTRFPEYCEPASCLAPGSVFFSSFYFNVLHTLLWRGLEQTVEPFSILELRTEIVCCILMQFCGLSHGLLSVHWESCSAVHRCTCRPQVEAQLSWVGSSYRRCMPLLYLTVLVSGLFLRKTFGCYKWRLKPHITRNATSRLSHKIVFIKQCMLHFAFEF